VYQIKTEHVHIEMFIYEILKDSNALIFFLMNNKRIRSDANVT